MLGSNAARACTLSWWATPWSVSAALNSTLFFRANASASCRVSVGGACVDDVVAGAVCCPLAAVEAAPRIKSRVQKLRIMYGPPCMFFRKSVVHEATRKETRLPDAIQESRILRCGEA